MIRIALFFLFWSFVCIGSNAMASSSGSLFDIEERRALLQRPDFASIRSYCMAQNIKQPSEKLPAPVAALKPTKAYGSDKALEDFSYYLMIHSGRVLAGDAASEMRVKNALLTWARANALEQTPENYDTYYALKRGLLPIITSYEIVRSSLSTEENRTIAGWIDPLVRRIDAHFGGKDVDQNNHRYLADAVLTVWGDVIGDRALYAKGKERFMAALAQMAEDGALPLEARRGARALWYIRQSLANLTVIATVYARNGDSLYTYRQGYASLPLLMNYFITGVRDPSTVLERASENHIPGPSNNFMEQDMGMLSRRGHGRHYMAFVHMYLAYTSESDTSHQRLLSLIREKKIFEELPLIDEFAGGNATCFWAVP